MATKTETLLSNLVINYLSESDYNSEVSAGTINENEIYMTPMSSSSDYTHPTYTARASGLYKITVDNIGHVSNVSAVTKSDITALGIPAQDTVYSLPTASSSTLGGVKTTSDVSSTSGLTACPIISGVPYYKDTNTTYTTATTSDNGLMSSSDKSKLDGIATGATKVVVDSALSTSSTNAIQNKIVTTELNGKQSTITGAATTITSSNLTASRALASDSSGKVAVSAVTSAELGYLSGVTSEIQTQLNGTVKTTGAQTVAGTKTFNDILKVNGKVSNTTETSNSSGEIQIGSDLILRDYGNYSYIIGGTDGTGLKIGQGLFVNNTAVSLEGHTHNSLYHESTGNLCLTCIQDSGTYYVRKGSSMSDINVCSGSNTYPWYNVYTENLRVSGGKPVFTYIGSDGSGSTVSYATNMYVASGGTVSRTTNTSSRTIKHDIMELKDNSIKADNLYDVNVYQAKYNEDVLSSDDPRYLKDLPMFIIEDLDEKYPVVIDKPSENVKEWSWNAQYIIPPMLKLIQDQKNEIDNLKTRLDIIEKL